MATDTKQKSERSGTDHPVNRAPQQQPGMRRDWNRDWDRSSGPFSVMRQGLDEAERWFNQLGWGGFGRGWMQPSSAARGWMSQLGQMGQQLGDWMPAVEAFQRGNDFVVRAEVPGMNRQDLNVEVGDDCITIHGERKREHEDDRDGVFWTERTYGSFTRTIPLPPGTITDSAKATFNNGILEIVMQAPSTEARRGRKIDIAGMHEGEKK